MRQVRKTKMRDDSMSRIERELKSVFLLAVPCHMLRDRENSNVYISVGQAKKEKTEKPFACNI